jgi:DNA-binding transcriptional LysR family regulator
MSLNLRRLDLNLLTVFEAVYEERSQQKASERLYMSQPAISNAISRLRTLLDDKLFYGNKTIQTTHRADELYPQVHQALSLIRAEILEKTNFEASQTRRQFTIAISYASGFILGSPILRQIETLAPGAKLIIRTIDPHDEIPKLLRDQTIDLAVSHRDFDDPMILSELCLNFEMVAVVRKAHPRIQAPPDLEALQAEEFVTVHDFNYPTNAGDLREVMDISQSKARIEVPNALMLPIILEDSDLVSLIPRVHADLMAQRYDLAIFPLPISRAVSQVNVLWHRAYERDPGIAWLRQTCLKTFSEIRQKLEGLYPDIRQ